jgi:plastocyanin
MKPSVIVTIVVAVLVIAGAWYWYATSYSANSQPSTNTTINTNGNGADYSPNGTPGSNSPAPTDNSSSNAGDNSGVSADVNAGVTTSAPKTATVTLTASGFSPKSITIAKGGTVTFVNQSGGSMWVASDQHPSHTEFDGTNRQAHCAAGYTGPKPFDQCGNGNSYMFTFDKAGSFSFHNHLNADMTGIVVVQ